MKMFATALLASLASVSAGAPPTKPHLVLMVIDDVGWSDVGYHGSDFPTPNIDALASQGVRLEKYYVQQVCSPTRSALLSGRLPFHTGMQHKTTLLPKTLAHLPKEAKTLPEALASQGYRRHAIGKWHLGYASWDYTPTGRGFESHAGYFQGQGDYYTHTIGNGGQPDPHSKKGFDFWRNRTAAKDMVGKYSMDFYMDEAQRILDVHDPSEPLFLYFAHQEQHVPLQSPPEPEFTENCAYVKKTDAAQPQRLTLCSMMNRLDKAIGDFVEMLKAKGMWENTLLWVTTDNGGMSHWGPVTTEASYGCNHPLRGGKATLFEGGVRVVSFVAGGLVPTAAQGTVRHGLMQHVDVAATMAALGGADLEGEGLLPVDGLDAWDLITSGAASAREEVVLNVDNSTASPFHALIQGDHKLIVGTQLYDGWWSNGPYTHTSPNATQKAATIDGKKVWLFDLSVDPEERKNVASEQPELVEKMLARIAVLADSSTGYLDPQDNAAQPEGNPDLHDGCLAPFLDSPVTV